MEDIKTIKELYDLWVLLAMTRDAIYRATKEELSKYGVTPIRSAVMLHIDSLGSKATPPEIGRYLLRKRNSISDLLSRMEQAELVKRSQASPTKKSKRYELTAKGRELYHKTIQLKTVEHVFSSLSPEQRQQLQSLLRVVFEKALEELDIKIMYPC